MTQITLGALFRPALLLPFGLWMRRRRTRQALRALDADLLKDVGLTPSEAFREGRRPMWRGGV